MPFIRSITSSTLILTVCFSLVGCESTDSGQTLAKLAGAGIGAVGGAQLGEGRGRIVGAVVGAAAGAWLGGKLHTVLSKEDQTALKESTQTTVSSGNEQTFSNPQTGVKGRTRVIGPTPSPDTLPTLGQERLIEQIVILSDGTERTEQIKAVYTANGWEIAPSAST